MQMAVIGFFALAVVSLIAAYLAAPSIYAEGLSLDSTADDPYPLPVTLSLIPVLGFIALLVVGIVRRWRWAFWLILVAFTSSLIHIPVTMLQLAGVVSGRPPAWYGLYQICLGIIQLVIAAGMVHLYRCYGVWAAARSRGTGG